MMLSIEQILALIDLTSLRDEDSEQSIRALCSKGNSIQKVAPASICVYPKFGHIVNESTDIPLAVVAGDFPNGTMATDQKLHHLSSIMHSRIAEIDWVINPEHVKNQDRFLLMNELTKCRAICKDQTLKIIIESGELKPEEVNFATTCVIESGADFVKTSTGKMSTGATEEDVKIICQTLNSYYIKTGKRVGVKISGGLRTLKDTETYISIVKNDLGEAWLNKDLFRIGASSLWNELIQHLGE